MGFDNDFRWNMMSKKNSLLPLNLDEFSFSVDYIGTDSLDKGVLFFHAIAIELNG